MRYDYQCEKCEHVQEEEHPMSGPIKKITCNKCKSGKMNRYYNADSVPYAKFEGPGWITNEDRGIQK